MEQLPLSAWPDNSGQVSYELILIFAAVIGLVTLILSNYIVIKDSTIALIIAKEKTVEKLNQIDSMEYIEGINFELPDEETINLTVTLSEDPSALESATDFDDFVCDLQDEVILRTKYDTVTVMVNSSTGSC